jgi:hypothetical protein
MVSLGGGKRAYAVLAVKNEKRFVDKTLSDWKKEARTEGGKISILKYFSEFMISSFCTCVQVNIYSF